MILPLPRPPFDPSRRQPLLFPQFAFLGSATIPVPWPGATATLTPLRRHFFAVGLGTTISASLWNRPPVDAVFVVDVSGSMATSLDQYYADSVADAAASPMDHNPSCSAPSKFDAAVEFLCHTLDSNIMSGDSVAVVAFSSTATLVVPRTAISSRSDAQNLCLAAREGLRIGGTTNLDAGYALGLDTLPDDGLPVVATQYKEDGHPLQRRARRLFVLTDEQPNVFSSAWGKGIVSSASDAALLRRAFTTVVGIGIDFNADIAAALRALPGAAVFSMHERDTFFEDFDAAFNATLAPLVEDASVSFRPAPGSSARLIATYGAGMAAPGNIPGTLMQIPSLFPSLREAETGKNKGGALVISLEGDPAAAAPAGPSLFGHFVVSYVISSTNRREEASFPVWLPLVADSDSIVETDPSSPCTNVSVATRVASPEWFWRVLETLNIARVAVCSSSPVAFTNTVRGFTSHAPSASASASARKALWLVQFGATARAWVLFERLSRCYASAACSPRCAPTDTDLHAAALGAGPSGLSNCGDLGVSNARDDSQMLEALQSTPLIVSPVLCPALNTAVTYLRAAAAGLGVHDSVLQDEFNVVKKWEDLCTAVLETVI
jgi:Mg-chelatase subunit ChlD